MSAGVAPAERVRREAWLARLAELLARAPYGNRDLDLMIAEALGWDWSVSVPAGAGRKHWRRWRASWVRQRENFPPRYSRDLDALLAEVPTSVAVRMEVQPPPCFAQIGHGERCTGATIELALAAALIGWRLAAAVGSGAMGGEA